MTVKETKLKNNHTEVGYWYGAGGNYYMYTMRGWIVCDTIKEIMEEEDQIASLIKSQV